MNMTGNREVITGSDFKRMVSGAYSEFLLEYEEINALKGAGHMPGTHILRTMGAAVSESFSAATKKRCSPSLR